MRGGIEQRSSYCSAQRRSRSIADYVREPRGPTAAPHGPADPARGRPAKLHRPAHEGLTGYILGRDRQSETGRRLRQRRGRDDWRSGSRCYRMSAGGMAASRGRGIILRHFRRTERQLLQP
jgi:hypothetical protein